VHEVRNLGEQLARQKADLTDGPRELFAGFRVKVYAPQRSMQRRRALRDQAGDDASQRVAPSRTSL
jgi:hypothetical protein